MNKVILIFLLFASVPLTAQKESFRHIGPVDADIRDFCVSPGGSHVYMVSGNSISLYDLAKGQQLDHFEWFDRGAILSMALTSDSTIIVFGTEDGSMAIQNLLDGSVEWISLSEHPVTSVALNAFDSQIACGGSRGEIFLTDISGGSRQDLKPHDKLVTDLEFTHDGSQLLSSDMDGKIVVTIMSGELPYYELHEGRSPCRAISCSADGTGLLASFDNGDVLKWMIKTGGSFVFDRKVHHLGWVLDASYHPVKNVWASCTSLGKITLHSLFGNTYTAKVKGLATRVEFCPRPDNSLHLLVSVYQGGLLYFSANDMKLK